ncbi:AFG1-like ATPase-domain-containing protein [Dunaliella salina]|uniref:AFG1-like ATPase-domain-containing protein n=1 Tax=Dunaliella salina TaxID=3046 RepID=A0ABQ7GQC3_DUNSA|nr:AFG1-like ATPase-domain-containing protein [Dunaliella salina]|eukprot:KAF5836723.1 AFG1-like ATPase-domain-containing protein [Dunaliella salina]
MTSQVATSNRPPDKLYEGGLQRSLFMPFIDRLKDECQEHNMESKVDYRRLAHSQRGLYFSPLSWDKNLREEFGRIAEDNGVEAAPETVQVAMGRHLDVALSAGKACMFTFDDLCGKPVAAADYIALTEHYHTLALSGVPKFNTSNVPQAYRFVTLIDVLYEHRVRVLISAEAFPFDLFDNIVTQAQAATNPSLKERQDTVVDDNLGFAKDRTISRLTEMQSLEYLLVHAQRHSPESMLALQEANRKNKFWLSFHRKEQ